MRGMKVAVILLVSVFIFGCAASSKLYVMEPTIDIEKVTTATTNGTTMSVSVSCVPRVFDSMLDHFSGDASTCTYLKANITNIPSSGVDKAQMKYLLGISDSNCNQFLLRTFANKKGIDFSRSLVSNLVLGASAVTAFTNPWISAGLSVGNYLLGAVGSAYDDTVYTNKTDESTLRSAILEARNIKEANIYNAISSSSENMKYSDFHAFLSDLVQYDQACSIMAGMDRLKETAKKKEEQAQIELKKAKSH